VREGERGRTDSSERGGRARHLPPSPARGRGGGGRGRGSGLGALPVRRRWLRRERRVREWGLGLERGVYKQARSWAGGNGPRRNNGPGCILCRAF
jgi:hypothetical protein